MTFSNTSKLQSAKSIMRNQIRDIEQEIKRAKELKGKAYIVADKGSVQGEAAFRLLNETKDYERYLKRILSALSQSQRLIKRELSN